MIEIFCTNCGKQHTSTNKFCEYCGQDLADVILRQKQKRLPVKYEQSIPPQQEGDGIVREIERERSSAYIFLQLLVLYSSYY